jgi:hypothetical protein
MGMQLSVHGSMDAIREERQQARHVLHIKFLGEIITEKRELF